jgi:hypothetical protein
MIAFLVARENFLIQEKHKLHPVFVRIAKQDIGWRPQEERQRLTVNHVNMDATLPKREGGKNATRIATI